MKRFLHEISNQIKDYFSLLLRDETVAVAVRLVVRLGPKASELVYRTYARSKGLNKKRGETSEDIPINQGIPKFLRKCNRQGVLIYNDFGKAAADGAYTVTENDRKYPNDIRTAMVAPLNAWSGKKADMIGILFITSRHRSSFAEKHVDALGFVADMLADSIATRVERLKQHRHTISSKNGR